MPDESLEPPHAELDGSSEPPRVEHSTTSTAPVAAKDNEAELGRAGSKWTIIFARSPEIAQHTVSLLLSLTSLWVIHLIMKYLLGDPKFFGVIPVQWVIDVGDIVLLIKFIWHLIKNFNK